MAESNLFIGSKLKSARRKNKIKISKVVEDLCIPKRYISAYEENDLSELPDNAYAVGYLKNYAKYLGLDYVPMVAELKAQLRDEPLDIHLCRPMHQSTRPSWLGRAAAAAFVGLLITGAYYGWDYFKGNDYKLAAAEEIPAHLASFLGDVDTASSGQLLLANGSDSYFQNLGETGLKVRILAYADIQLAITDASGKVLHQGLMLSGESFDLPRGADLCILADDYSALGFFLGTTQVTPENIRRDGARMVVLDALKPSMSASAPTS